MSDVTYRIGWKLFLEGETLEESTDEFTPKNFNRLINFLNLYDDCISYHVDGYGMKFICNDEESAYVLTKRINDLANKKTKDKNTAISANSLYNTFEIKDIKVNGPATIVLWADGTKTVVKCGPNDSYDAEKAVAMCFMKKALGSRSMRKIFDLAEDKVAEYDNQFKRLEFTDLDTYFKNTLNAIFNPNPGKLYEGNVTEYKMPDEGTTTEYKIPEDKDKE